VKVHENRYGKTIKAECHNPECDYYKVLSPKELDFLQPDNPLFSEIYGTDPIAEARQGRKKRQEEKEKEKEKLDRKYWERYSGNNPFSRIKTSEEKYIRKNVLKGD
jgi:hypothetical protein